MKSISVVEYLVNGNLIQASDKISLEEAIMIENAVRFVLAHSLPLLQSP